MTPAEARAILIQLDLRAIAIDGFAEFVKRAWHVVEPKQPLEWNWHLDEFCLHATLCMPPWKDADGKWSKPLIRDLVVNVPPGTTKSKIWSVLWPAWIWTWRPDARIITASYATELADGLAREHYQLVTSPWYTERWPTVMPRTAQGFTHFRTNASGWRFATTIGGAMTGKHADLMVIDDPVKPGDADASAAITGANVQKAVEWLGATAGSRTFDKLNFVTVLVMQRLTEFDPSERMLIREGVVHLMFPALFEVARRCITPWGGDPRTIEGEPMGTGTNLTLAAFSATAKGKFGGWNTPLASAQLQQRPSPPGGLMFRTENFIHFDNILKPLKGFWVLSVDANFRNSDEASDIGIAIIGSELPKMRIYGAWSERGGFIRTIELIKQIIRRYGRPGAILIEARANGDAIIETLIQREKFPNVIALEPHASKEARAQAANVYYESKSIEHARNLDGLTLAELEHYLETFPRGRKKDIVDAIAQGVIYLASKDIDAWKRAVNAWGSNDRAVLGSIGFDDLYSIG